MPNSNRQRGDYFERRTKAALESHGWVVIRAAGSKGPADLWAARSGYNLLLISCKLRGQLPRRELHLLCDVAEQAGAYGVLARWLKPGWVGLEIVTRHGNARLPDLHMPAQKRTTTISGIPDGLMPAGEQLTLDV